MSHFYASIQGSRGKAARPGGKEGGINGHIRGWSIGARVSMFHKDGKDVCQVYKTGGSNGRKSDKLIAEFSEDS